MLLYCEKFSHLNCRRLLSVSVQDSIIKTVKRSFPRAMKIESFKFYLRWILPCHSSRFSNSTWEFDFEFKQLAFLTPCDQAFNPPFLGAKLLN